MIDNDGVTLPQIAFLAYGPPFLKDQKFLIIAILLPFSPGMEPISKLGKMKAKHNGNKSIQWSIHE